MRDRRPCHVPRPLEARAERAHDLVADDREVQQGVRAVERAPDLHRVRDVRRSTRRAGASGAVGRGAPGDWGTPAARISARDQGVREARARRPTAECGAAAACPVGPPGAEDRQPAADHRGGRRPRTGRPRRARDAPGAVDGRGAARSRSRGRRRWGTARADRHRARGRATSPRRTSRPARRTARTHPVRRSRPAMQQRSSPRRRRAPSSHAIGRASARTRARRTHVTATGSTRASCRATSSARSGAEHSGVVEGRARAPRFGDGPRRVVALEVAAGCTPARRGSPRRRRAGAHQGRTFRRQRRSMLLPGRVPRGGVVGRGRRLGRGRRRRGGRRSMRRSAPANGGGARLGVRRVALEAPPPPESPSRVRFANESPRARGRTWFGDDDLHVLPLFAGGIECRSRRGRGPLARRSLLPNPSPGEAPTHPAPLPKPSPVATGEGLFALPPPAIRHSVKPCGTANLSVTCAEASPDCHR
jgi:hypothetical protein